MRYHTRTSILAFTLAFCSCAHPAMEHVRSFALTDDPVRGEGIIARATEDKNGRGIYAILWIADTPGAIMSGTRQEIHHHRITPSVVGRTVYALQHDYSLLAFRLTEEDKDTVFADVLSGARYLDARQLASRPAWKKIIPSLQRISAQ